MRHFTQIIFLFVFFMCSLSRGEAKGDAAIAAVVNGKAILVSDVAKRARLILATSGQKKAEISAALKQDVLRTLIDEQLQIQFGEEYEIQAESHEIDQAFKDLEHQNRMDEGGLDRFLGQNNLSRDVLKQQLRASIIWRKYIQGRFRPLVQVSAAEVQAFVKAQEKAKNEPQYLLGEIVLPIQKEADEAKVRKQAQEISQQLKSGASFPMIAQQVAQAPRGGDIGWISRGQLEPALCRAIDDTTLGQTCGPVRTKEGYTILMVRDQKQAGAKGASETLIHFHQVFLPLSMLAREEEAQRLFEKASSISHNAHSGAMLKRLAQSIPSHRYQEVPGIPLRHLPPPLQDLLTKLPLGQASPAIHVDGGFIVFLVENRRTVVTGEMTEDDIKLKLIGDKLENISRQQLAALRSRAFIDIRI